MHLRPSYSTHAAHFFGASVLFAVLSSCIVCRNVAAGEPSSPDQWIEALGDDSYHVRLAAEQSLLKRRADGKVNGLLVEALHHESLEVRHRALSILRQFQLQAFDEQLQRLADSRWPAENISLPGWQRFAATAGDDRAARAIFDRIVRQHGSMLRAIEQSGKIANFDREFDPYRIPGGDPLRWAVLLMCDQSDVDHRVSDLSNRVVSALCNLGLGPCSKTSDERTVITRLISHWIVTHSSVGTPREHLLVAMRFQCHDQAHQICDRVLADENATPSAQATAMLVANVLQKPDLSSQLRRRLDDDRTAHVWQLIASRKTKIRTQIRDVALALLLHRGGIDPRQVGFNELQADPLLVFRDHSLGFPSEETRRDTRSRANVFLNK